ncbi:MAG: hypothetical protein IKF91_04250 [Bacilli bacterium]|nr:hypothetical protein [Bacilli bacterium]
MEYKKIKLNNIPNDINLKKYKLEKDNSIKFAILNSQSISAQYLIDLIKKYCSCEGLIFDEKNFDTLAFRDWIKEYIKITHEYAKFLTSHDIDLNNHSLAEVGKGKYDSIIGPDAYEISDYSEKMGRPKLIFGDTKKGLIICDNKKIFSLDDLSINWLITQNPNSFDEVDDFSSFANYLNRNITLGIYGNFSDKNMKRKMNMLKKTIQNIDNATYEYDTLNDYFYAMVTARKTNKQKVKK